MPVKMSRIEAGVRTVLAYYEAFNRHDVAGMMQFLSDDCTFESAMPAPDGAVFQDKAAIAQFWKDFYDERPQAQIQVEDVFGLGWRCVAGWRLEWVEANGEKRHVRGVDVFRVRKTIISEILSYGKSDPRRL